MCTWEENPYSVNSRVAMLSRLDVHISLHSGTCKCVCEYIYM